MTEIWWIVGTGVVQFVATFGALRVHLQWLRRDVDDNTRRINELEKRRVRHG